MKALLLLATAVSFSFSVHAQGTVNFANGGAGVNAPIGIPGGQLASTANGPWLAMLYAGPAGTPEHLLSAGIVSGSPAVLGATPGYVFGGARTISGVPSGSQATLQIRIWRTDLGASWEEAGGPLGAPATARTSPTISMTLGGGPTPTPNMVGAVGVLWDTPLVPEPSTTIVGMLGLVAMFVIRRKRSNAPLK